MKEQRFSSEAIQMRLRRTSSPPLPSKKIMNEVGLFKMPPAPIMIEGLGLALRINEFFGRTEGDTETYVSNPDLVISLILGIGDAATRGKAVEHLLNILPRFGEEKPFLEMVAVAKRMCDFNRPSAALRFLETVDKASENEDNCNILIKLMPIFNEPAVIDSLNIFAKIGTKNIENAISQLIDMGLRLKDGNVIINISETIRSLNKKFGKHVAYNYRNIVAKVVEKLPENECVKIIDGISKKMLSYENDEDAIYFTQMVEHIFTYEKNPLQRLMGLLQQQ